MTKTTAAEVIAGIRVVIDDGRPRGGSIAARLHRLKEHGWARATARMLLKRVFVEGVVDSSGSVLDPAGTPVEILAQPDWVTIVRLRLANGDPIDLRCLPNGPVEVVAPNAPPHVVEQWRNVAAAITAAISA